MSNPFEVIEAKLSNIESLLLDIKHGPTNTNPSPDPDEILTVKEAAAFLRLSVPTIYTLTSKGELPVLKRSKRCYYLKTDLINYLKEGRKKSARELAIEADEYIKKGKGSGNGK